MKNKLFDKVIVSSDDAPMFLNFWPTVSQAYQKYFGLKPDLALVTNFNEDHELLAKLRKYGDVHLVKKVPGVPIANQAKVARFLIASKMDNHVCMIEDIDTIPLQDAFISDRLSKRAPGEILAVGHEVLKNTPHAGKFPISNITSEGYNFKRLFNPLNLELDDCIKTFIGLKIFDHKEDISKDSSIFSDESLVRALIEKNGLSHMIKKVDRNVDIHRDWIDRSWWNVDKQKLKNGDYVLCNFLRPFKENIHNFWDIIEHVYGYRPEEKDIFVL